MKSQTPDEWKEYQVLFIDKKGKQKMRPIALSSCWVKMLERMINTRLVWWAEKQNVLDKDQNEFRKGRGSLDNLMELALDVKKFLWERESNRCILGHSVCIR